MNFKKYRFSDVLEKVIDNRGKTPPTVDEGIPLIQSFMLGKGNRYPHLNEKTKYVSKSTYDSWFRAGHPKKGDVLIAVNGSIGEVSLIDSERYSIAQDLIGLRFNSLICEPIYMYYCMISPSMKEVYSRLNNGATRPSIRVPHLMGHDIEIIEDVKVQKKIANILSSLDDKIELNNKTNKTLEELAQTLYKRWFADFEFPNEDGEPYKSSGGEMVERELGLIPKGWEIVNLIDIVDKINGYSYKGTDLGESSVGMLTIKNSTREKLFNIEGFKELCNTERVNDRHYAKQGDVLIVCTDVTQNADYIGNAVYIYTSKQYKNLVFSMDLIKLVSKREEISNHLVYEITRDARFKNFALGYTKGTTVLHLNKDVINDYKLALPNKQILILFDNLVSSIHDEVRTKINENIELVKLRDTLLPKLMSGEIEVPVEE